ncbi:MAG: DUF6273 domain-containing protein [Clostridiales Family XIII bacterium]|jgi:hypothetical protein|nr:DUF6273 domain-containing protein [Clostridiales Family XIII bacterium]
MNGKEEAQKILDRLNGAPSTPVSGTEPVEWLLATYDEATGRALAIAKDCVAQMPYHSPGGTASWDMCSIRGWLNADFFDSLPPEMRERVLLADVKNPDNCSIPAGDDTQDYLFLLSLDEYANVLPEALRCARYKGRPGWWWLRSPGYASTDVANVLPDGSLDGGLSGHGFYSHCDCGGIRPACYLNLA